MRSYFQYIACECALHKMETHSDYLWCDWYHMAASCNTGPFIKNKIKVGRRGYFMGGCMLVWVHVCVWRGVCGVTACPGAGMDVCVVWHCVCVRRGMDVCVVWLCPEEDRCVCDVTLCVCVLRRMDVWCDTVCVSRGGWMGVWCDCVVWHCVCLEGDGCGVTLCPEGDRCVCGVTLCVRRGMDGCCMTLSVRGWMGLWCDSVCVCPEGVVDGCVCVVWHVFVVVSRGGWMGVWYGCWPFLLLYRYTKGRCTQRDIEYIYLRVTSVIQRWSCRKESGAVNCIPFKIN